jgi:rsbT co-antagonist protein RsbR
MTATPASRIPELLKRHAAQLLDDWIHEQKSNLRQSTLISEEDLRRACGTFLKELQQATQEGNLQDLDLERPEWSNVLGNLQEVSRARGQQGFSSGETASYIFSLKKPLFKLLGRELGKEPQALADTIWTVTELLDRLGLYTVEVYQKAREEVIIRQQEEMIELSTPVVKLWEGILALPLIGTLDSARTQVVMESLLQKIVATGAEVAILDITGVPTVDTLVAQHLIKTVTAARLMGADCIISGIRPQIAQTIVHLGVNLNEIITKATLADAFQLALKRSGQWITQVGPRPAAPSSGFGS